MIDTVTNDKSLVPENNSSDARLTEAVKALMKIDNGEGTPADLETYVDLSYAYYSDQLKDPKRAIDPEYQKAALHFKVAKEGGPVGLMGFCVAALEHRVKEAQRAEQNNAPKTRDGYLLQIQNWSRLMSQIGPQQPQTTAVANVK
jgi:hypothetical protein